MHAREDIVKAIGEAVALRAAELRAAEAQPDAAQPATEDAAQPVEALTHAPSFGGAEHDHVMTDAGIGLEAAPNSGASTRAPNEQDAPIAAAANDPWPDTELTEPASAAAPYRVGIVSSIAWGAMGFLIGAVFWHFIGFWGFVSEIVFVGGAVREERLVEQTGPQCVQLVLDRSAGTISSESCPFDAPLLNEGALAVRADFVGDRGPKAVAVRPAIRLTDGNR